MNTPEERRREQINAIAEHMLMAVQVTPIQALDNLIAHFEKTEPAVADAIRYGLKVAPDSGFDRARNLVIISNYGVPYECDPLYSVDFPEPDNDPSPDPSDIADLKADERRADEK